MFEHTASRYYPFRTMLDLMSPLVRQVGPELNRETVENVKRAGFDVKAVDYVYLDVVKMIHAQEGKDQITSKELSGKRPRGGSACSSGTVCVTAILQRQREDWVQAEGVRLPTCRRTRKTSKEAKRGRDSIDVCRYEHRIPEEAHGIMRQRRNQRTIIYSLVGDRYTALSQNEMW